MLGLQYNFDHPDAFDLELLKDTIIRLKEMKKVDVPIYNFVKHARETKTVSMYGANVIIFEGLFAFHNEQIRDMLDMKVCCCFYLLAGNQLYELKCHRGG